MIGQLVEGAPYPHRSATSEHRSGRATRTMPPTSPGVGFAGWMATTTVGAAVSVRVVGGSYREAWASVTRNRNLRLAQLSSVSAWTGEFLFLTAMTVYAFDNNGAVGVGLIGFLRVLPATAALPWLGALADRMSRRQLLVVTCGLRAVTAAGAGLAAAADQPAAVYTLLTVSTICHAAYRPV